MRRRLRERYNDDELMRIYESPHQHSKWEPTVLQTITFHKIYHYDYQLWLCR